ncbi:hypothetical protein jhhlp_006906 [Lomentospora prolificans]|uniref:Protein kinase domain-containing protein n=1 Tax=Lomentospora prolificans TaxID=41688 RepID=A0A2N3N323_9PEZI|nr:hypothetical protein jhhlp_006906 [Lomentospora prolificans]
MAVYQDRRDLPSDAPIRSAEGEGQDSEEDSGQVAGLDVEDSLTENDYFSGSDESESPPPFSEVVLQGMVYSQFDVPARIFLPSDFIAERLTIEVINEELSEGPIASTTTRGVAKSSKSTTGDTRRLTTWILSHAKKLFITAILCEVRGADLLQTMKNLYSSKFTDDKLPLVALENGGTEDAKCLPVFKAKAWRSKLKVNNFFFQQCHLLAPIFDERIYEYSLRPDCILPFVWKDSAIKTGAFSEVLRVKIHASHRSESIPDIVAIKVVDIRKLTDEMGKNAAWEIEANALKRIRNIDHDHILKCIAEISRGDFRYFMFPWASGGSLRDFWNTYAGSHPRPELVEQAIDQLYGLADALDKMHNYGENANEKSSVGTSGAIYGDQPNSSVSRIPPRPPHRATTSLGENIRHGDLKPENILRFADREEDIGNLKIGDMGLAKHHLAHTDDRGRVLSTTRYGTWRYQAPEALVRENREADQPRSRREDIWAMGCIILEFIVWLLYGNEVLTQFTEGITWQLGLPSPFYERVDGEESDAKVHQVVQEWIYEYLPKDAEIQGDSALRDLLEIVKTKLLVVRYRLEMGGRGESQPEFPEIVVTQHGEWPKVSAPVTTGPTLVNVRATAAELRSALQVIKTKIKKDRRYLLRSTAKRAPPPTQSTLLRPPSNTVVSKDYALPKNLSWQFPVDNQFAGTVLASGKFNQLLPQDFVQLCSDCNHLSFCETGSTFDRSVAELKKNEQACGFCRILIHLCDRLRIYSPQSIRLRMQDSGLKVVKKPDDPALTILRTPTLSHPFPIQVGFPKLPIPGTPIFFDIIRLWLKDCDQHLGCQGRPQSNRLPTRLVDIGTTNDEIRLYVTTKSDQAGFLQNNPAYRYIALSHPWGNAEEHPPFLTLPSNKDEFMRRIPFESLPRTFADAVVTTRALGIRYLWIDSLCIVQGPDGDFNQEAQNMETVFSSAYCVIAASRAENHHGGFLGPRKDREFISIAKDPPNGLYVCETIDNFDLDVVEGHLNRRGWVLQERALARRTIYFTETQTYFECGNGIRSESLRKMKQYVPLHLPPKNPVLGAEDLLTRFTGWSYLEEFLGDPNFPDKAMASRGLQITYFQQLYQKYSRLDFTRSSDRPIAIAGLERRLNSAYGTSGAYGIFGNDFSGGLFHRSLLWCRGQDEKKMEKISFPADWAQQVPSWSWMAYKGGIDYMDPPFKKVDWETSEIRPTWQKTAELGAPTTASVMEDVGPIELRATMRDFDVGLADGGPIKVVYDAPDVSDSANQKCIVVAKAKEGTTSEKDYYVLITTLDVSSPADGCHIYKRIGVGKMPGKCIVLRGSGSPGKVR